MFNQKIILLTAGVLGALAVSIGAFGAHALKAMLESAGRMDTFETGVKYHFYHVLALCAVAMLQPKLGSMAGTAGMLFTAGIVVFSGSLYVLCLTGVTKWGAVTPFGGLMLIAGWVVLAVAAYTKL